jgi:hypothetical protein
LYCSTHCLYVLDLKIADCHRNQRFCLVLFFQLSHCNTHNIGKYPTCGNIGTGTGQANAYWRDLVSVSAASTTTINLTALPMNVFGTAGTLGTLGITGVYRMQAPQGKRGRPQRRPETCRACTEWRPGHCLASKRERATDP